jgi:hypothetical protein
MVMLETEIKNDLLLAVFVSIRRSRGKDIERCKEDLADVLSALCKRATASCRAARSTR